MVKVFGKYCDAIDNDYSQKLGILIIHVISHFIVNNKAVLLLIIKLMQNSFHKTMQ
jgi:hypothetical protein